MPELPEVETFARSLREGGITGSSIINRQIISADLFWERTLAFSDAQPSFLDWFPGKVVSDVSRRGKYLLITIEPKTLLIHLRMSGDLRVAPGMTENRKPHDRFELRFSDGESLFFNDTRKFGRIWLMDKPEQLLSKLGIEPLSEAFSADWLYLKTSASQRLIKPFLLDQHIIAGLGNIYTDEALFRAGIHPLRRANSLSDAEASKLAAVIPQVLLEGIRSNGASIDWVYRGGNFQNHFQVYQRTGKPCVSCQTAITKIAVGQRGTHFCPHCQPLKPPNPAELAEMQP